MLNELNELPDGLLETGPRELAAVLGGPTLIHLAGEREPALFVSVLMHGNEAVGWEAIRALLSRHRARRSGRLLPRALSLFIGNVTAAAQGVRHLPGQPDYNRVWPGTELPETPEHGLMRRVVDIMAERGVFASVDVHNNTGLNPHYGCVNRLDHPYLSLATLFSRIVVYFLRPKGVQSLAMSELCPAVTLECGRVGDRAGVEHASRYLDACLNLAGIPEHPIPHQDIDLFHTVAQVKIPEAISFSYPPSSAEHRTPPCTHADLLLSPELERFNFRELDRGTAFGRVNGLERIPLEVRDEEGRDVTGRYFTIADGELRLMHPVMPAMLSHNESIIRQDCLCYLMERFNDHVPSGQAPRGDNEGISIDDN